MVDGISDGPAPLKPGSAQAQDVATPTTIPRAISTATALANPTATVPATFKASTSATAPST